MESDKVNNKSQGGCPIAYGRTSDSKAGGGSSGGCPVRRNAKKQTEGTDDTSKPSPPFAMPPSLEESARHEQTPRPDQRIPLSTQRVVSSIPRADDKADEIPQHQPSSNHKWVYPSEQQFYNAMRRKGWHGIDESTIPLVVRIHNDVNEKGWREVQRWESTLHGCNDPRLVRFLGRPNDISPKAWFNTNIMFREAPFDRHDWFVDRGDGQEPRRYVIDFYEQASKSSPDGGLLGKMKQMMGQSNASPPPESPATIPKMYIDVRPALDSPEAAVDRFHMFMRETLPGIFWALDKRHAKLEDQSKPSASAQS
jgi:cytochrome c heme-lyase